ncbi:MAG: alpha/beta fold hydrolase [Proteobacteria bacterium]|nr:alpha/beta fold hydrolase [Pseudomonadota bacterium]
MILETAGGITLGYDDLGGSRDPAVVLIGGLATQRTVWPDTLCTALVESGHRVIRFDNRDMGESSWWDAPSGEDLLGLLTKGLSVKDRLPYTIDDLAADATGLMDALALQRAHVVGMSMGGLVAQSVAVRWPDRVESLVSMMSTTGNPSLPSSTAAALQALMTPPADPFDQAAVTDLAIMQQRVIGSPLYPMPDDYVRDIVSLNFARGNNPEGALRQWLASSGAGDRRAQLASIRVPTLVLHGRDDPLVPPPAGEDTARTIPGAKLRLIDGWGHNIPPSIGPLLAGELLSFWGATLNGGQSNVGS